MRKRLLLPLLSGILHVTLNKSHGGSQSADEHTHVGDAMQVPRTRLDGSSFATGSPT